MGEVARMVDADKDSTALVATTERGTASALVPRSMAQARDLAEILSRTSFIPADYRGKPDEVFAAIAYGLELGFNPLQALQSIYVVKGRPMLNATAARGLVQASSVCEYFIVEGDAERATATTKRRGHPKAVSLTYTLKEAQTAGLTGKDNWKSFPARMLKHRVTSHLASDMYADVTRGLGIAEREEFDAIELQQTPGGDFEAPAPPPRKSDVGPTGEADAAERESERDNTTKPTSGNGGRIKPQTLKRIMDAAKRDAQRVNKALDALGSKSATALTEDAAQQLLSELGE